MQVNEKIRVSKKHFFNLINNQQDFKLTTTKHRDNIQLIKVAKKLNVIDTDTKESIRVNLKNTFLVNDTLESIYKYFFKTSSGWAYYE